MWEFRLTELLIYYPWLYIDIYLYCLDKFGIEILIIFYMSLPNCKS
jgi:hypothetical protein